MCPRWNPYPPSLSAFLLITSGPTEVSSGLNSLQPTATKAASHHKWEIPDTFRLCTDILGGQPGTFSLPPASKWNSLVSVESFSSESTLVCCHWSTASPAHIIGSASGRSRKSERHRCRVWGSVCISLLWQRSQHLPIMRTLPSGLRKPSPFHHGQAGPVVLRVILGPWAASY